MSDDRQLAGFADDVVLAHVVAMHSPADCVDADPALPHDASIPWTCFDVQVLEALKGRATGSIVVAQEGGLTADRRVRVIVDEQPPMRTGADYLIVAREDPGAPNPAEIFALQGNYAIVATPDKGSYARLRTRFQDAVAHQTAYRGAGG